MTHNQALKIFNNMSMAHKAVVRSKYAEAALEAKIGYLEHERACEMFAKVVSEFVPS